MIRFSLAAPAGFSFASTVFGHGWATLAPFELVPGPPLELVWRQRLGRRAAGVRVRDSEGRLAVAADAPRRPAVRRALEAAVTRVLRLDEDLSGFHDLCARVDGLGWIPYAGAGRLIRAPTLFEDLLKTLLTTNCAWSATRRMVANLLAAAGVDGCFPRPADLAGRDERWWRDRVRVGYRAPFCVRLVAEAQRLEALPLPEALAAARDLPGFGPYALGNLARLAGDYRELALDSWLRRHYAERYHRGRPVSDRTIARRYRGFGEWQGLACWLDLFRDYVLDPARWKTLSG